MVIIPPFIPLLVLANLSDLVLKMMVFIIHHYNHNSSQHPTYHSFVEAKQGEDVSAASEASPPLVLYSEGHITLINMIKYDYDAVSGHVESLSQSVIKILTLHRVKKIFFQKYHKKAEIRSFPTMYIKGGSSFGRS